MENPKKLATTKASQRASIMQNFGDTPSKHHFCLGVIKLK
jgi:hypothetical protein